MNWLFVIIMAGWLVSPLLCGWMVGITMAWWMILSLLGVITIFGCMVSPWLCEWYHLAHLLVSPWLGGWCHHGLVIGITFVALTGSTLVTNFVTKQTRFGDCHNVRWVVVCIILVMWLVSPCHRHPAHSSYFYTQYFVCHIVCLLNFKKILNISD